MSVIKVASQFPIIPDAVSTRIFFAKQSASSTVWHLCDAALGYAHQSRRPQYMALHGAKMFANVKCDSYLQAVIQRGAADRMCYRCLDEFVLALPEIEKKVKAKFNRVPKEVLEQ